MKLVRFGKAGKEKPGLIDADGALRDLSEIIADFDGDALSPRCLTKLKKLRPSRLPRVRGKPRLGPPVAKVGHFIAVGLNYSDHAAETGAPTPKEPILFNKAPSCLSGPHDDIVIPPGSEKTDWEVELALVIGSPAYNVGEDEALDYVAGYCLCNDLSERAWQMERGGQWMKGKSAPTFGPLGPWLVTPDEIADPQNLQLWLDVNGERMQAGSTANMIFGVRALVAYISRFLRLEPGDVITTGTPAGVGLGKKPPLFLKPGDTVSLGGDGLGRQASRVVGYGETA